MKKIICILSFLTVAVNKSYSQDHKVGFDNEVFPFISLSLGNYSFADIGVCLSGTTIDLNQPFSFNFFIASEFKLNKNFIVGPKIGGWVTYKYLSTGLSFIDYTDFKIGSLIFRPEVGAEYRRFKLTYGYNLRLGNNKLAAINSHQGNLTYTLRRQITLSRRWKKNENFKSR